MPHQITVNNRLVDVFSSEEIETDPWLNGKIPMFTGEDIVEAISMSRDQSFSSTSEYYFQTSRIISCLADEGDRSEAWFLKKESIGLISQCITESIHRCETTINYTDNNYKKDILSRKLKLQSLLKQINNV